jgi:beta-galactosidase
MRNFLSRKYIPFGSQYYRAPSPQQEDWENDLSAMAKLGFNMVKFWVQWRWNHPSEDQFYFDDIDQLMDLAEKKKLKVMLNTIFDVAPAWIYNKYPDASMVTLDGRKIAPQTQPHRQIGGLGYCLNHPAVSEHFFRFLSKTVKRYKAHPALEIWNVGSEPELTSSMAEMRLYADNADKISDMLCFCRYCQEAFRKWLHTKYGQIDKLNESWNRNYGSFAEVEIPKTRNTFNDMIDWRMFFVYTMGKNVKRRFEVAAQEDGGMHPLMCHHVFIQGFPVTSTANDPWNVGKYGDLHGFTQMDDAMMIDVLRSCAKNKPVISAEMLMLPGYTLDLHTEIDKNDVKRFIFSGIAGNLKGFIFWQYRPEILGREAPAWGLSSLDGSETSWLNAYAECGRVLQKNASFLLIDFIHPIEIEKNILENYKVVYIPFPYLLGKMICSRLRDWVREGGLLISEAYFAGWNIEHGHHEKIIPGNNFQEVFKVQQDLVQSASDKRLVEIEISVDLPDIQRGTRIQGAIIQETLSLKGARVLAHFQDGTPAISYAEFGKGKAIMIGSYIALPFLRNDRPQNGNVIASLVQFAYNISRPSIKNDLRIRIDFLSDEEGKMMLIVQNLECRDVVVSFDLPTINKKSLIEQFSGEILEFFPVKTARDRITAQIELDSKEVKVYCG